MQTNTSVSKWCELDFATMHYEYLILIPKAAQQLCDAFRASRNSSAPGSQREDSACGSFGEEELWLGLAGWLWLWGCVVGIMC